MILRLYLLRRYMGYGRAVLLGTLAPICGLSGLFLIFQMQLLLTACPLGRLSAYLPSAKAGGARGQEWCRT